MDSISNDIQLIIYRYIFEVNYKTVRNQYIARWLNNPYFWNEKQQYFGFIEMIFTYKVCNHRDLLSILPKSARFQNIFNFDTGVVTNNKIPKNY